MFWPVELGKEKRNSKERKKIAKLCTLMGEEFDLTQSTNLKDELLSRNENCNYNIGVGIETYQKKPWLPNSDFLRSRFTTVGSE